MKKFILLCIVICVGTIANAQINFNIKLLVIKVNYMKLKLKVLHLYYALFYLKN